MRLCLFFSGNRENVKQRPNKHAIQGLLYKQLGNSLFYTLHDQKTNKAVAVSDWLIYNRNTNIYYIMISSPIDRLIDVLTDTFTEQINQLKFLDYMLFDVKKYNQNFTRLLKTGSPIVLNMKNKKKKFYSFRDRTMTLPYFDQLLKESAIIRYRHFINDLEFTFEGSLFEQVELRKEVAVPIDFRGRKVYFIGTTWNQLILRKDKSLKEFYTWLIDAGLGQKTTLGFGFLQPIKLGSKNKNMIWREQHA